ncbi:uncharacterized protein CDAR_467081 [Caerostris darwini]|uniref:Uncharacterized protein n=1 Tax=Caerostris darwini TaxID=1538125 RepID=A0AAV4TAA1_9ARAC|nr:uncharacterized protein CDAR_467081 [Caerostris darwini]
MAEVGRCVLLLGRPDHTSSGFSAVDGCPGESRVGKRMPRAVPTAYAEGAACGASPVDATQASLVPAAAVIPAPIAYIKVVVVKKLVVEPWAWLAGPPHRVYWSGRAFPSVEPHALHWVWRGNRTFTLKKLECSKQAYARIH